MNKQIEEMAKDIHKELETENIPYHECDFMAQRLIKRGWIKPDKDSVVLSMEEYERLKRIETEKDRLYEMKLDLENQLIEKGWTEYEGADEIEKRVSKETAEKIKGFILSKLYEATDDLTRLILREIYWQVDEFAKQFGVEIKE